jgi:hypothetical protein
MGVEGRDGALSFNGVSWSRRTLLGGAGLSDVSCSSASFCVAVDSNGRALSFNGFSWSAPVSIDGDDGLESVSCASSSFCVAVDAGGHAVVFDGVSWSEPALIDSNGEVRSVSCASSSFCVAVDAGGDAVVFDGVAWGEPVMVYRRGEAPAVSCVSSAFCVAIDREGDATIFDGTSWSIPTAIGPGELESLSCASTSFCIAGGRSYEVTFNGVSWSDPIETDVGVLFSTSVSCASSLFCTLVGDGTTTIALNDGSWDAPAEIDSGDLTAVSCPSSSFCVAVDGDGRVLTDTPLPLPPAGVSPPAISGTPAQGHALTETPGSWINAPTSYSYQWQDCNSSGEDCKDIEGATGQTYALTTADVSHTIRVREAATNSSGTSTATSSPTAVVQGLPIAVSVRCVDAAAHVAAKTIEVAKASDVSVRSDVALIPLTYRGTSGSSCTATLTLSVLERRDRGKLLAVSAHDATRRKISKPRLSSLTVIIAHKTITLQGGVRETVHIPLNAAGKRLLNARHTLAAKLIFDDPDLPAISQIVKLKAPSKRPRSSRQ